MSDTKRLFVGGLVENVTEPEVEARFKKFGEIKSVEIKIKDDILANQKKTFAYVDIDISEDNLAKCMKIYHKSKWRGKELQIQVAKENFVQRLKKEREAIKVEPAESEGLAPDDHKKIMETVVKSAKQGTPVENMRNWVVGKNGEILPVVYIRRKDKKKVMKVDPTNFIHNNIIMDGKSKKSPAVEAMDTPVDELTWQIEERKEKHQQEIAETSTWKSKKTKKVNEEDLNNKWRDMANGYKKKESVKREGRVSDGMVQFDSDEEGHTGGSRKRNYDSDDDSDDEEMKITSKAKRKSEKSSVNGVKTTTGTAMVDNSGDSDDGSVDMSVPKWLESDSDSEDDKPSHVHKSKSDTKHAPKKTSKKPESSYSDSDSDDNQVQKKRLKAPTPARSTSKQTAKNPLDSEDSSDLNDNQVHQNKSKASTPTKSASKQTSKKPLSSDSDSNSDSDDAQVQKKETKAAKSTAKQRKQASDSEDSSDSDSDDNPVQKTKSKATTLAKSKSTSKQRVKNPSATEDSSDSESDDNKVLLSKTTTPAKSTTKQTVKKPSDSEDSSDSDLDDVKVQKKKTKTKTPVKAKSTKKNPSDSEDSSDSDSDHNQVQKNKSKSATPVKSAAKPTVKKPGHPMESSDSDSSSESENENQKIKSEPITPAKFAKKIVRKASNAKDSSESESGSDTSASSAEDMTTTCRPQDSSDDTDSMLAAAKPKGKSQAKIKLERSMVSREDDSSSDEESDANKSSSRKKLKKKVRDRTDSKSDSDAAPNETEADTSLPKWLASESDSASEDETVKNKPAKQAKSIKIESSTPKMSKMPRNDLLNEYSSGLQDSVERSEPIEKSDDEMDIFDMIKCGKISSLYKNIKSSEASPKDQQKTESKTTEKKPSENKKRPAEESKTEGKPEKKKAKKEKKAPCTAEKQKMVNEKRLETVKQRQQETRLQKSALQKALASVDSGKSSNKKIVFDSDEEDIFTPDALTSKRKAPESSDDSDSTSEEDAPKTTEKQTKEKNKKPTLFAESSSEEDEDEDRFKIRTQFEGKSGSKLLTLQSKFGNDTRFRMDKRFADSASENDEEEDIVENAEPEGVEAEKNRAMDILKSVVGDRAMMTKKKEKKPFKDINALHYDPSSENHEKFEIAEKVQEKSEKSKKKKKKTAEPEEPQEQLPEVSKEQFFEVTTSLKNLFEGPKDEEKEAQPFSLMSMFGTDIEEKKTDTMGEERDIEKVDFSWRDTVAQGYNEDNMEVDQEDHSKSFKVETPKFEPQRKARQTFFFTLDDPEIQEGLAFFSPPTNKEEMRAKWQEKRPALVEAYRMKRKRTLRETRITRRSFSAKRGRKR